GRHVPAHRARRNAGKFLARFIIDQAEQMMGAWRGKIAGPTDHSPLEIALRLEGFKRRGKIPEDRAIQAEDAESNLPDGVALTRRQRHVTGPSRLGLLVPRGVAAD